MNLITQAKEELKNFKKDFDKDLLDFLKKEKPQDILKWISYYIKIGGKRIRPFIAYLIIKQYNGDLKKLKPLLYSLEIYHNSILILDDVQDNDEYRRNKPSLWKIIGKSQAINVGFYGLLFSADLIDRLELKKEKKEEIARIFDNITKKTVEGQFLDFYLSENWEKLSNKKILRLYLKMIILKTAYYLLLPALSTFVIFEDDNKKKKELIRDFIYVGMAFQLMNDIEDIVEKKNDLKRKLPTLPFILLFFKNNKYKKLFKENPDLLIKKAIKTKSKILNILDKIETKLKFEVSKVVILLIKEKIKNLSYYS